MSLPIELYAANGHACMMFTDLAGGGEAVQANQFLIIDHGEAAVLDPGGVLAFNDMYLALSRHVEVAGIRKILASHADPDIIASLDRWMSSTQATLYISVLWERFAPHFCKPGKTDGRIVGIPDRGMRIELGRTALLALPAHFMHAEGNFQFWDPVSRILFSGDLGVSIGVDPRRPVDSLQAVWPHMEPFHRRYMVSNRVLRWWAAMARQLPIAMIVPQHGAPLRGAAVREFIDRVETLQAGIDLMTDQHYAVP